MYIWESYQTLVLNKLVKNYTGFGIYVKIRINYNIKKPEPQRFVLHNYKKRETTTVRGIYYKYNYKTNSNHNVSCYMVQI